jgi:hypothetical protein
MGILDNLDLSKFLAPAGYAPQASPPGPLASTFAAQNVLPPGGAPQSPPGAPLDAAPSNIAPFGGPVPQAPAPAPNPMAGVNPGALQSGFTPSTAIPDLPGGVGQRGLPAGLTLDQTGASAPPVGEGGPSQGLLTGGGPDIAPPSRAGWRGLLDRLTATDPETGRTFNDRLMAISQIMQGDTPGAQAYLEKQQEKVINQRAINLKQQIASAQSQAFAKSFRPDGTFDAQAYARNLPNGAFDIGDLGKLQQSFEPKAQLVTDRQGNAYLFDPAARTYKMIHQAAPKLDEKVIMGPNNQPIPNPAMVSYDKQVSQSKEQEAESLAEARAAAAERHRAPPKATNTPPQPRATGRRF